MEIFPAAETINFSYSTDTQDQLLNCIVRRCQEYFANSLKIIKISSHAQWLAAFPTLQADVKKPKDSVYLTVLSDHTFCINHYDLVRSLSHHSNLLLIKFPSIQDYLSYNFHFQSIFKYSEVISEENHSFIYLFFSNQYWYAGGHLGDFSQIFLDTTFMIKDLGIERNYYENSQYFMKYYYILTKGGKKHIKKELDKEIDFLKNIRTDEFPIPKIIATHSTEHTCWLLREKLSGESLEKYIRLNVSQTYNPVALIASLLKQASFLEIHGYYHTDIVPRNTLVLNSDSAILIDFGAFEKKNLKFDKLIEVYLKYIMLSYEIIHNVFIINRKFTPLYLFNKDLHPIYRSWIQWILSVPMTSWNFLMLEALFKNAQDNKVVNSKVIDSDLQRWFKTIHALQQNKKLRLRRFQYFLKDKLDEYFYEIHWFFKVIRRIKYKCIIFYDTVTLFGKKVTGQVPPQGGANDQLLGEFGGKTVTARHSECNEESP